VLYVIVLGCKLDVLTERRQRAAQKLVGLPLGIIEDAEEQWVADRQILGRMNIRLVNGVDRKHSDPASDGLPNRRASASLRLFAQFEGASWASDHGQAMAQGVAPSRIESMETRGV
jgi:hypothetical protein